MFIDKSALESMLCFSCENEGILRKLVGRIQGQNEKTISIDHATGDLAVGINPPVSEKRPMLPLKFY